MKEMSIDESLRLHFAAVNARITAGGIFNDPISEHVLYEREKRRYRKPSGRSNEKTRTTKNAEVYAVFSREAVIDADPLIALEDDPVGDTVHQPYSAFNQGFTAGSEGIPISLNPYPEGSREFDWWNDGHEHGTEAEA